MDLIIGAITGYKFEQIAPWVNSLERSGFSGDKMMLCYNIDEDLITNLRDRGFIIVECPMNVGENIVVSRFRHAHQILNDTEFQKYNNVIMTDVKDVIFQSNPSYWIELFAGGKLIASSESIRYKDEEWGRNNLFTSFGPHIYSECKDNIIYNAGVIAGDMELVSDMCLSISLLSASTGLQMVPGGGGPDQAAYNILLSQEVWKRNTIFVPSESGWAAQLGTTGSEKYSDLLVENSPKMSANGILCTSRGIEFTIVHQYDRIPEYKRIIESKYS